MKRLSASRVPIALHCVAFLYEGAEWMDETSTYAKVGTGMHSVGEAMTNGDLPDVDALAEDAGMTAGEAKSLDWLSRRLASWTAKQDRTDWKAEVKFAYDPITGEARELPAKGKRDYSAARPHEIVGTADLVYVRDGWVYVVDYKSGWGRKSDPASQLESLAMMAAKAYGVSCAVCVVLRVTEDDEPREYPTVLNAAALEAIEARLADILTRAENATEEPKIGPHCGYCPHKAHCSAVNGAVADVVALVPAKDLVRKHKLALAPTDDEHAAWTFSAIRLARDLLEKIETGLREYVDEADGIVLPNGDVYRRWEEEKRALKLNAAAVAYLEANGLAKAIDREPSATIGSITKAAGGAKAGEEALEALEALGAITKKKGSKYEARPARKGVAA